MLVHACPAALPPSLPVAVTRPAFSPSLPQERLWTPERYRQNWERHAQGAMLIQDYKWTEVGDEWGYGWKGGG